MCAPTDRRTGQADGHTYSHTRQTDNTHTHIHIHSQDNLAAWTLQVAATYFQLRLQLALKCKRGILSILGKPNGVGGRIREGGWASENYMNMP